MQKQSILKPKEEIKTEVLPNDDVNGFSLKGNPVNSSLLSGTDLVENSDLPTDDVDKHLTEGMII